MKKLRITALLLALCMLAGLCACSVSREDLADAAQLVAEAVGSQNEPARDSAAETGGTDAAPDPDGVYTSKEDVALYLHVYGELPKNFITKNEARALGWSGGGLDRYADGMCIGGDRFGNYEGILPDGEYRECDIDTLHASGRGAKRLVYSADGRIYYTEDHYESFTLLYGEE